MQSLKKIILFFLFLESILVNLCAPTNYNSSYIIFCSLQFVVSALIFISLDKNKNLFNFNTLFLLTYFFVLFYYPLFVFQTNKKYFSLFVFGFNDNVVSRSVGLALLGSQSYILGAILSKKRLKKNSFSLPSKNSRKILTWIGIVLFVLFLIMNGYADFKNTYSGESLSGSTFYKYILVALPVFCIVPLCLDLKKTSYLCGNKLRLKLLDKLLWTFLFVLVFSFLFAGSRTLPLQIALTAIAVYSALYSPMKFVKFSIITLCGCIVLFMFLLLRGGKAESFSLVEITSDLIINNRNSFVAIDYVDKNGITFGTSMLSPLLAPIPFAQNICFSIFDLHFTDTSSSYFFTKKTLGYVNNFGLGSNIIADIYLAFGTVGVVVLMFILGNFLAFLYNNKENNSYIFIAYYVMMSYSVFIVRAEFFFPLRLLVWSILVLSIIQLNKKNCPSS